MSRVCGRLVARVRVAVTPCHGVLVLGHGLGDGPARPLFSARTTRVTLKPGLVSASRRWGTAVTLRLPTEVCQFGRRLGSNDGYAKGEKTGILNRSSVARLSYDELDIFRICLDDALPFGEAEACCGGQGKDKLLCLADVVAGFLGCEGALHGGDVVQAVGDLD